MATRDERNELINELVKKNAALIDQVTVAGIATPATAALLAEIRRLRWYTAACTAALALYRDRENWIVANCEGELTGQDFQIWQWAPHGEYADGTKWATAALAGTLTDYAQPALGLGEEHE